MLTEIQALELSVVLWFIHVLAQMLTAQGDLGLPYLMSARDDGKTTRSKLAGRAHRVLWNYVENFGAFIALDLGLIATSHAAGWGPTLWIVGRVLQFLFYLAGIPVARTLSWALSIVGLILMLVKLAGM
jgi:uncharacterized MAPEG superfamily protein